MQRRLAKSKTLSDDNPFSLSLGDLMAGLLLIFVLLLSFVMLRLENLMEEKRRELELIDVRERIKKSLISRLLHELSEFDVEVDPDTGVIRITEGILFDFGKAELKQDGKDFLRQFTPQYVGILLSDPLVEKHIAQVIIEGHTDDVGGYEYNLSLSLRRANSVVAYLFTDEFGTFSYAEDLRKLLSANGRSFVQPIASNDSEEGRAQNRRVEFQFRLRDWDMVSPDLEKLLEIETGMRSP
ncbi:MAG: OmpA family protein [Candidatus Poribacteria bacterium]|nr:OmpA family protein [Candidatus Poribacteria bacterium]